MFGGNYVFVVNVYTYIVEISFVLIKESVGLHWEFELVSMVVIMI